MNDAKKKVKLIYENEECGNHPSGQMVYIKSSSSKKIKAKIKVDRTPGNDGYMYRTVSRTKRKRVGCNIDFISKPPLTISYSIVDANYVE